MCLTQKNKLSSSKNHCSPAECTTSGETLLCYKPDGDLFQRHRRGATKSLQLAEARQHGAPPRLVRLSQDYLPVGPKPCGVEAGKVRGQSVGMAHEQARTEAAELVRVIEVAPRAFGVVQSIHSLRLVAR